MPSTSVAAASATAPPRLNALWSGAGSEVFSSGSV